MVSLQASISQEERKSVSPNLETFFSSSKKRKWQEEEGGDDHDQESKEPKLWKKERVDEFHLDSPLPLEWQRCLDIKSGQIHFYNTRTHKRTSKDPRSSPEPQPSPSLDLELNLNSTKHVASAAAQQVQTHKHGPMFSHNIDDDHHQQQQHNKSSNKSLCSPSWITIEVEDRQQEMVAAVCMRCHMLVMMCKATPSCPNCKFVHPQGHNSSSSLLNKKLKPAGFTLLCCKD